MDCVCVYKQPSFAVAINSNNSYYVLTSEGVSEIDSSTRHVRSRIPSFIKYQEERAYTLQLFESHLYLFSATPEYSVYSTEPAEFLKSVLCSGKKPYIPSCILVACQQIIFSTLSHSNIYLFSLSILNTLGQVKKPVKLKLPSKVAVNMLAIQPNNTVLAAACNDGLVRLWNLETKEELLPIVDTGISPRNKKNIVKAMKSGLGSMNCVSFSCSGEELISGDDKGMVYAWRITEEFNLATSKRISEQGVNDVCQFGQGKFLTLVKESRILLLEIIGNKMSATPIYTLAYSESLSKIHKCLYVFENKKILLFWPPQQSCYLLELNRSNSEEFIKHLPGQKLTDLLPTPISYPPYFYFYTDNKITSFSILNNESKPLLEVSGLTTYFIHPMVNPNHILLILEKEVKIYDIIQKTETKIEGFFAVFSGPDDQAVENIIVLKEDRTSVGIYNTISQSFQSVPVNLKIKRIFYTPNSCGVTYETAHEHSIRLSKGFKSALLQDAELDSIFRLEYDEILVCLEWNIGCEYLAFASNKRICILDTVLHPIKNYNLQSPPLSIYWYGSTLIASTGNGLHYCGDSFKMVLHTFEPSFICAVLADRVYLFTNKEVKAFPCTLLEPLLWGSLESNLPKEKIEKTIQLLPSSSISQELLEKLLKKGLSAGACYLSEKTFTPLHTRLEILKSMQSFKDLEKTLFRNKPLNEHQNLAEDIHLDHNWKLEKSLLPGISNFFDSKGQFQRLSKFLKLEKSYYDLSILHLSVGNNYPPEFNLMKLKDFTPEYFKNLKMLEPALEDLKTSEAEKLDDIKLAFGESAFSQQVDEKPILTAYSDNLSQVFGWDALKRPEKIIPKFIDQEIEEKAEESENDLIYLYFRCDEGKGTLLNDVVNNKTLNIKEDQWAGMLEEGDPLDYDDKWGKQAAPNYRVLLFNDSYVVIDEMELMNVWSCEFWISVNEQSFNLIVLGSFIIQVDHLQIKLLNKMVYLDLETTENHRQLKLDSWEHFCVSYNSSKLVVFLNSAAIFSTKPPAIEAKNSLIIGGFSGHITEIRIWKSFRTTELIRENYKCPLEILSEKRKKKWLNIKINKTEVKSESAVEKKPEIRLLKPDSGPKSELKPLSGPGGFKKLAPPGAFPLKFPKPVQKNPLESMFKLFELQSYSAVLQEIEKLSSEGPRETLNLYKFVSKMMISIEKYKKSRRNEKQLKAAACFNLLIKVKLNPEHRIIVAIEAVKQNIEVGNYGIAAKMIYNLMDHSSDEQTKLLEELLADCVSNEKVDKAEGYQEVFQQTQEYFASKLNSCKEDN